MYDWMSALGAHYRTARRRYPHDKLLVLFDIDGTILDMRHLVHHVLHWYDRINGTDWFVDLSQDQVTVHENRVGPLLHRFGVPEEDQPRILEWYYDNYWDRDAVLRSLKPFDGVMQVARWFQSQPNTMNGLNTGRLASQRLETIRLLNRLGAPHGVYFSNRLLFMRADGWKRTVPESKVAGVRTFRAMGYRVIAMVDNEPDNLAAIAAIDPRREILLLHADTLFMSHRDLLPGHVHSGQRFDANRLMSIPSAPPRAMAASNPKLIRENRPAGMDSNFVGN